ncbi:hypothetical protein BKA82DRAFT_4311080 [Pisolithus tinctorius]|nr:hypothetical protein BKA82DRAFT_4311080 [Pisolithus tinctorius]
MPSKISADLTFHSTLSLLFSPEIQVQNRAQAHLGLVLCERLISTPVQVVPSCIVCSSMNYRTQSQTYGFSHFHLIRSHQFQMLCRVILIISPTLVHIT